MFNSYKDQLTMIKDQLQHQNELDKKVSRQLFLDSDRSQREFYKHKEREMEMRRWKYMSMKEKEQFKLLSKLKTLLEHNY